MVEEFIAVTSLGFDFVFYKALGASRNHVIGYSAKSL